MRLREARRSPTAAQRLDALRVAACDLRQRVSERYHPRPARGRRVRRVLRRAAAGAVLAILGLSLVVAAVVTVGAMLPLSAPAPAVAAETTAIEQVTVIDPRDGSVRPGQTILLRGRVIAAVGPSSSIPVPPHSLRLDGRGRFAIPGLWDMHVHTRALSPQLHFPLLVAHGVTSVRDLGDACAASGDLDCQPDAVRWRAQRQAGRLLAPALVATVSHRVERLAEAPAQPGWRLRGFARNRVADVRARGDRLLKLRLVAGTDPREFTALALAAYRAHIGLAAWVPAEVSLMDDAFAALSSIEHSASLQRQCVVARAARHGADCRDLLQRLARRRTAFVPTHAASARRLAARGPSPALPGPGLEYVAAIHRLGWHALSEWQRVVQGSDRRAPRALHPDPLALTRRAVAAGVPVLAGSDAYSPYMPHGIGLHEELEWLVRAGLTPVQALRSATWTPAVHAGAGVRSGAIEAGREADLLLLTANPLDDIRHTRRIDTVVMQGAVYRRPALDRLLDYTQGQALSFRVNCRFLWNTLLG